MQKFFKKGKIMTLDKKKKRKKKALLHAQNACDEASVCVYIVLRESKLSHPTTFFRK